jgi:hypothetical protein
MSVKSIIETVRKTFSVDAKMQEYEGVLRKSIAGSYELKGSETGYFMPYIYVALERGADINKIKNMYEKVGIKLEQRLMRTGNRLMPILCIQKFDFERLDEKHRDFFNRTAPFIKR